MTAILLVGCGKMGGAMLDGWIARGASPSDITVVEPNAELADTLRQRHGVQVLDGANGLDFGYAPDVVILAVKPQMMDAVLPAFADIPGHPVFLSIAAGRTIAGFEAALGGATAIVRAMPNTPAAVGRAVTVCCPNAHVTDAQRTLCQNLLAAVGQVEWIADEVHMDAVTAVSGSGPAYVFLMAEALAEAGRRAGLDPELAERLARATVAGAGELLHQSPEAAATLRQNVTSPGGTTAAALEILMGETGLTGLMDKAVAAAARRSKELAN
ncbi:MAG: pyrroline-5-carboxylate reductase [Alphaproteobacteria bacterium]|nr:pyrroline-5-carboxylate reductase [Alphaproteobacteria bacterium]